MTILVSAPNRVCYQFIHLADQKNITPRQDTGRDGISQRLSENKADIQELVLEFDQAIELPPIIKTIIIEMFVTKSETSIENKRGMRTVIVSRVRTNTYAPNTDVGLTAHLFIFD